MTSTLKNTNHMPNNNDDPLGYLLSLRLDTARMLSFLQQLQDKDTSDTNFAMLLYIGTKKLSISDDAVSRLRDLADLHPQMNIAEFARCLKVSRQTIYNWKDDGMVIFSGSGHHINLKKTILLWETVNSIVGYI